MTEPIIHTDTVIQAFSELAPGYEDSMQQELQQYWGINYLDFIHEIVTMADIQAGESVLDIATGTGRIPRRVIESDKRPGQIIGLDITHAMLIQGKKYLTENGSNQQIRLICGSALDLPFGRDSFDVILCGLGTHHIQVPRLISEVHRVIKPGGRLLLADVCASKFWRSRAGNFLIQYLVKRYRKENKNARAEAEVEAFNNVRTAEEWFHILKNSGFSQIDLKEIKPRLPWYPGGFQATAWAG